VDYDYVKEEVNNRPKQKTTAILGVAKKIKSSREHDIKKDKILEKIILGKRKTNAVENQKIEMITSFAEWILNHLFQKI
jgi:hypothetical protein